MKRCLLFLILVFASTACDSKKGAAEKAPDKEEDYVAEYAANRPQWLPADSRIVFSFTFRDGWTDDLGMLMIKATMSKDQFEALVHKLELVEFKVSESRSLASQLEWGHTHPETLEQQRWDPSLSTADTYVREVGDWKQIAQWRNGYLYYQSESVNGNTAAQEANNE